MAVVRRRDRMKKELSLFGVFALSTGTTLSAGFFLLPGLAAQKAGPAMILCYLLAAVPMVPAIFSILELTTAMPRAGGAYYFIDRSLGPMAGMVGGLGTWLALVLKTAFALVGMGAYANLLVPQLPTFVAALSLAIIFGIVNLYGAKESGKIQVVLVIALLTILTGFIVNGLAEINTSHFEGFFDAGVDQIIATAGMVYISYVGVTKVASVSEEVKNPDRNLPWGIFLSFGCSVLIYGLGTTVMIGVLNATQLAHEDHIATPVASVASAIAGPFGMYVISAAALFAFSSVANAGILSASRYPLAMSRDHLVSSKFRAISRRRVPVFSVILTVIAVMLMLSLNLERIVKLASAAQLLMFALLNFAVIVMRESRIESYDPGFRSPFYPYMQLVGFILPFWLIAEMGWLPMFSMTALVVVAVGWYYYYADKRVQRHGAIFHVFERLGRQRFVGLDRELRSIMKEKGLRPDDPFEEVVEAAELVEAQPGDTFDSIVDRVSRLLAENLPCSADKLAEGFLEGTRIGATPVGGGVALPHLRVRDVDRPHLVMVRSITGISLGADSLSIGSPGPFEPARALFFLVSPEEDPGRHLRTLAELAERVDDEDFLEEWVAARSVESLRDLLIRRERYLSIEICTDRPGESFIGRDIREIMLPIGCLIVLVHRDGDSMVPTGSTTLAEHDRLSIIGNSDAMAELRRRLGLTRSKQDSSSE